MATNANQSRMHKLLISIAAAATLFTAGCSTVGDGLESVSSVTDVIPDALQHVPLLYKPEVEQGNVVSQEQVDKLKPGMSRRQVSFVLGTPTLQDIFHDDRWDYPYTRGEGSVPEEYKYLTVYFEDDRLVRVSGDLHPLPADQQAPDERAPVVAVPDWEPESQSLWGQALNTVGLGSEQE